MLHLKILLCGYVALKDTSWDQSDPGGVVSEFDGFIVPVGTGGDSAPAGGAWGLLVWKFLIREH